MAEQSGDWAYSVADGKATVTSYTGAGGAVVIPAKLDLWPVVAIGDQAFHRLAVTSVTIPYSVTSIGDEAFAYCTNLTNVTIPPSVTSIGIASFISCTSLTSLTVPKGVTSIRVGAFKGCSGLTALALPSGVTSIGNSAFGDCSGLTSVTIPNSVTYIGGYAFAYCRHLTAVTIPAGVTTIENSTFSSCESLKSVTIPKSVTRIGDFAFDGCDSLTGLAIPSSITAIGSYAFSSCHNLSGVTIPNRVTSIGKRAFSYCFRLNRVDFAGDAPAMGSGVFSESYVSVYRSKTASGFKGLPWTGFYMSFNDPPLPWISKEIGGGKLAGYSIYNSGTFTQAGSGNFGGHSDKLRFTYQKLSGDGEITAQVKSLENTGNSSRVGVMIRDSLATKSPQVFIGLTGSGSCRMVQRAARGKSNVTRKSGADILPNAWLKLVREGDTISAYKSNNGTQWDLVKRLKVKLPKNCFIGLAVVSGSNTSLNTSKFGKVRVKP